MSTLSKTALSIIVLINAFVYSKFGMEWVGLYVLSGMVVITICCVFESNNRSVPHYKTHRSSSRLVEMNTNPKNSDLVCSGRNDDISYELYKHIETGGFFYVSHGCEIPWETGEPWNDIEGWTMEKCGAEGLAKLQPYL